MSKIQAVHIPADFKNLAINGNFDFWQRVEATTTTVNTATVIPATYATDMFTYQSGGTTVKNYSVARSTATLPTLAQSGFNSTYSYQFNMITGIASPAAGDYVLPVNYRMEGLDYERLHTKIATFGFWFIGSIAGTYSFALGNATGTRSYVTTFTLSAANTWQFISITAPLDTTGTWAFDNTLGLIVYIAGISGTTFATSTLNSWQAGEFLSATGATNWQATTGATINVAQFSIAEGSLGLGAKGFQRQGKSIAQELALCQRYYEKSFDNGVAPAQNLASTVGATSISIGTASGNYGSPSYYKVTKRTGATVTTYNTNAANNGWWDNTNSATRTQGGIVANGATGFSIALIGGAATSTNTIQWSADAGI